MGFSQPSPFDSTFLLFAANYLLDGLLTIVGLSSGVAHEANPLVAEFHVRGILAAKVLGLASIAGITYAAARTYPRIVDRLTVLYRVALLVFSAVCVSNLAVLAQGFA